MSRRYWLTAAFVAAAIAPKAEAQYSGERLFYYVDREDSYNSLVKHIDQITVIAPQVYVVDSLGIMWGSLYTRVAALAKAHNVKIMALFTNEGFNGPSLRKLLADTVARARAIQSMVDICRSQGYWGIQFDVEAVNIADRDKFTRWYGDAARALHAVNCKISAALVHKTEGGAGPTGYGRFMEDSWRGGYDLEAIGRIGDFVSLMTYSEHTRRTTPGPVAGLPWTREALEYFLRYIPAEKISLGIPTYGGRWYTQEVASADRAGTTSQTVNWTWGQGIAARNGAKIQWDPIQQVPYASYMLGGLNEWLFLEDARSFKAKLDLAKEKKVRGFSVWVLGPEDEAIWDVLRSK